MLFRGQDTSMSNSNHDPETGVSLVDGPVHDPDSGLLDKQRERPSHVRQGLSHTLAEKNLMAITGLFLCVFLVVHLLGNLQLLLPTQVAQWQFNFYSKLLLYPCHFLYFVWQHSGSCHLCARDNNKEPAIEWATL